MQKCSVVQNNMQARHLGRQYVVYMCQVNLRDGLEEKTGLQMTIFFPGCIKSN